MSTETLGRYRVFTPDEIRGFPDKQHRAHSSDWGLSKEALIRAGQPEETTMLKTQAIANLSVSLAGVTTTDRARMAIQRALAITGLTRARSLQDRDVQRLLTALAEEGGAIESVARKLAIQGLADSAASETMTRMSDPTDRTAA